MGSPRLLIVHHTPSPVMHTMFESVMDGATQPDLAAVEVVAKAALHATAVDVMEADAYVLGTPANLGSMSGALKHFFDTIYYPCLAETVKRPYGLYVHGQSDVDGAIRDIEKIVTGLQWRRTAEVVTDPAECWELGAVMAAGLLG